MTLNNEKEAHQFCVGVYRHYKGKMYAVLGLARHSETAEMMVVYIPLYHIPENDGFFMAVRPLSNFTEWVAGPLGSRMTVPRFEYVGPTSPKETQVNATSGGYEPGGGGKHGIR